MDSRNRAIIIQAIIAVITIIAVTWGTRYNWPDYVHVKHGLPLTWPSGSPSSSWRPYTYQESSDEEALHEGLNITPQLLGRM